MNSTPKLDIKNLKEYFDITQFKNTNITKNLTKGNTLRKYGDHFIQFKDLGNYEINIVKDEGGLSLFYCKKHKEQTEDLAYLAINSESYYKEGPKDLTDLLISNTKDYINYNNLKEYK